MNQRSFPDMFYGRLFAPVYSAPVYTMGNSVSVLPYCDGIRDDSAYAQGDKPAMYFPKSGKKLSLHINTK